MYRKSVCLLLVVAAFCLGVEWTSMVPPARCAARMCVDSANQRVILFGGTTVYADGGYFNDVWEIPLDNPGYYPWVRLRPTGTAPAARADHCLVYDPVGGRMILFGGASAIGNYLNDVWALNLSPGSESWEQLSPFGTPPSGRAYAYAVYCPGRRSVVVFGGGHGSNVDDVWELRLDTLAWRQIPAAGAPSPRRDGAALYDAAHNRMLIYGGYLGDGFTDDLWALDLTTGSEHWEQLSPTGSVPSHRAGLASGATWGGDRLYVSCGWNEDEFFSDLYVLDVAQLTWTSLGPGGDQPMGRRNTCGALDPSTSSFFLFGGEGDIGWYLGDAYFADCANVNIEEPSWQRPGAPGPGLTLTPISGGAVRIHCLVGRAGTVTVSVFDAAGVKVRDVFSGQVQAPGVWLEWDGRDGRGRSVAAGTYYCTLDDGANRVSRKLVIAR